MDSLQKQDLRRPKIHGAVPVSPYQPPTLSSLQRLLWVRRAATLSHINEVWPNLFLGDAYAARDRSRLTQLGITHVVNVAAGKFQVDTGAKFYHGMPVEYYGIEADDNPFFDLSVYFLPVARYIRTALSVPQGRVLVHCAMGVSRSATVVLAFLMIYENMTLVQAIQKVQAHRDICPNSGFLRQLQVLDNRLRRDSVHHNKDRSPSGGLWDGGSLQGWPRCTRRLASSGSVQWQPRDGVCVPVGLPEGGGQVRTN
ncbi:dual specificity protein phosphatase 13A isoform 9-T10 [Molossus nigricans]